MAIDSGRMIIQPGGESPVTAIHSERTSHLYTYCNFIHWDTAMRLMVIAAVCFLLLLSNGVTGKTITKRHVRRDWLVIPDTVAFYAYEAVNKVSPEAGKRMMELFESRPVQEIRSFLVAKTSELSRKGEEFYQKITDFLNSKK
ncbi:apovitellenin-1-like [Dendropsophus ebraccatus]|uniref:apovitellenin-1-like n=1 Tax=Dendropsophus ebraccatus TaxID=150705 RepID=UPI003831A130